MLHSLVNVLQRLSILAWGGFVPEGGETVAPPAAGEVVTPIVNYAPQVAEPTGGGGFFGGFGIIAVYVLIFGGIWFFLLRPHKKREKKQKEMQATIKTGDNVVTNGGMFGKVTDVGTDCFVVEMGVSGRTVKIPILKTDVLGVREPVLTPPPRE